MIVELKPTNLIAVEVPEDSFGFYTTYEDKYTSLWLSEPKNEYESPFGKVNEPYNYFPALFETSRSEGIPEIKILGEVTKNKIGFDVEPYIEKLNSRALYRNYRYNHGFWFSSPYQSFYSLLAANGLYFENPVGYPTEDEYEEKEWAGQAIIEDKAAWQSFEDKLIKGELLILEKL